MPAPTPDINDMHVSGEDTGFRKGGVRVTVKY